MIVTTSTRVSTETSPHLTFTNSTSTVQFSYLLVGPVDISVGGFCPRKLWFPAFMPVYKLNLWVTVYPELWSECICPLKFTCSNLMSNEMAKEYGLLGEHWLMNGIRAVMTDPTGSQKPSIYHMKTQLKDISNDPDDRHSLYNEYSNTFILHFEDSRNVRNSFISYPVYALCYTILRSVVLL